MNKRIDETMGRQSCDHVVSEPYDAVASRVPRVREARGGVLNCAAAAAQCGGVTGRGKSVSPSSVTAFERELAVLLLTWSPRSCEVVDLDETHTGHGVTVVAGDGHRRECRFRAR